ncbi:unnamed protein product [Linum trigynum]|uniref:LOB domain-containing protein n=1 Tax=Linum trigynum TaxID=586398 RepID=A0AAV2G6S8_9ROSI
MTLKGGTSHACAACKYQRRKCTSECQLAPYFPSNKSEMFRNAHKLFGGCYGYICRLQYQIHQAQEELHAIHAQLHMCRDHHHHHGLDATTEDVPCAAAGVMAQLSPSLVTADQHQLSCSTSSNPVGGYNYNSGYFDATKENNSNNSNNNALASNSNWLQHTYGIHNNINNVTNSSSSMGAPHSQLLATQPLDGIQQEVVSDYDEMHLFFDTIDDRQSYIDSKEAYDTSSEESLKDTTQSLEQHLVAEDELKSAAACFSLTSVN